MKIALLTLLSVLIIGCLNTVEPSLPEATQLGKDTFGCLIDNQLWLPKASTSIIGSPATVVAFYNRSTNELKIESFHFQSGGSSFFILNVKVYDQSKAVLLIDTVNPENESFYYDANEYCIPLATTSNLIITKLDTLNRIVSGTFSLEVVGQRTQKHLSITKGVFDVKLEFLQ